MDLMNVLLQTGGVEAIAKQLGVPPAMAEMGAKALLPAVVGGFNKQAAAPAAASEGGLGGLINILGGLGGGGLATNVLGDEPTDINKGNDILGQIFGSKDVSRTVAGHAAGQTGLDPALLKQMLPILAMLVGGYMSHKAGVGVPQQDNSGGLGGGLGGILGSILGGGSQAATPAAGGLGGLGSLLDMDGDGNPLDDILGMAGKMMR